ncbi:MAG: helix-turn-helix domain-containing protein [Anaerovoracaceae bacterium]
MEITNKSIGLNIQKWRDNAGLTQEELAELVDLSAAHMTAIENGYSGISLQKIIAVSQVLHVSLDVLTGLEEQKRENAIEKVIPLLKDCSAKQIALIADIIKAVKRNPL